MSGFRPRVAALGLLSVLTVVAGACAGRRLAEGVFQSPKGYRVRVPGSLWVPVASSRADLELRHRDLRAGILVHALCERGLTRQPPGVLERQLLAGLRQRTRVAERTLEVDGQPATEVVVEVQEPGGPPVRVVAVTVVDARCVYDLVYAAAAGAFDGGRADFERFVASFQRE